MLNEKLASDILKSKIIENSVANVKLKLFNEFCKLKGEQYDHIRLEKIHSQAVMADEILKQLTLELTKISTKDRINK